MKVPGNRLQDMRHWYRAGLSPVMGEGEADAVFWIAAEHYLGKDRASLRAAREWRLSESEVLSMYDCCLRVKSGEPVQYVTGRAWFSGLRLKVDRSTLIPRPETEELCQRVIEENPGALSVLDLCTGSGCIALAIKQGLRAARVRGCDVSEGALTVARENAAALGLDVDFFSADVLQGASDFYGTADVIVSNPPYVMRSEAASLSSSVLEHEPHIALFAEEQGQAFYGKIADICRGSLLPGGRLYLELNPLTAGETRTLLERAGLFGSIEILRDMSGKQRFIRATRNP